MAHCEVDLGLDRMNRVLIDIIDRVPNKRFTVDGIPGKGDKMNVQKQSVLLTALSNSLPHLTAKGC